MVNFTYFKVDSFLKNNKIGVWRMKINIISKQNIMKRGSLSDIIDVDKEE